MIEPGDLQSYYDLIKQADVTIEDIEAALLEWADNPPDEEYATILEAELVER